MSCGSGIRIKTRTCDNPVPVLGGKDCNSDGSRDTESQTCTLMSVCPGRLSLHLVGK